MYEKIARLERGRHLEMALSFENELSGVQETYERGLGLYEQEEFEEAYELFRKAALDGHPLAYYMLGMMHLEGIGTGEDAPTAIFWLEKAYDAFVPAAATALGLIHLRGDHVPRDADLGKMYLEAGAAMGDPEAQYLHNLRLRSEGRDAEALELLKKSSDAGFPPAMDTLGWMHAKGQLPDTDRQKGIGLMRRAADLGNSTAMADLAMILMEDGGNDEEIMCLCRESAARGDRMGMLLLGTFLRYGMYCTRDSEAAARWFRRCAAMGSATAMRQLGKMIRNGEVEPEDGENAETWFTKAREADGIKASASDGPTFRGETDLITGEFEEAHQP